MAFAAYFEYCLKAAEGYEIAHIYDISLTNPDGTEYTLADGEKATVTLKVGKENAQALLDGWMNIIHIAAKGKEIYEWAVKNLVDSNTGEVADSKHGEGNPAWSDHVYNQATFIGASLLLYKATGEKTYLDNAILGADYTMNTMSETYDLLPFESGVEQGIYTAIFAEYMAMLVNDCGQTQYVPFLKRNINYGWANRDRTRNLCGGEYHKAQIEGATIDSYSASGIPALMLLFPADK